MLRIIPRHKKRRVVIPHYGMTLYACPVCGYQERVPYPRLLFFCERCTAHLRIMHPVNSVYMQDRLSKLKTTANAKGRNAKRRKKTLSNAYIPNKNQVRIDIEEKKKKKIKKLIRKGRSRL